MGNIYMVNVGKGNRRYTAMNKNFYKKSTAYAFKKKLISKGAVNPRLAKVNTD